MRIIVHSITVRATVIDETDATKSEQVVRTFTPEDKGLPGLISEIFRNITFYLLHNIGKQR